MSSWALSSIRPTLTVIAASPWKPSSIAPRSSDTISPSRITRFPGMPWTTSSFIDTHRCAGYPR